MWRTVLHTFAQRRVRRKAVEGQPSALEALSRLGAFAFVSAEVRYLIWQVRACVFLEKVLQNFTFNIMQNDSL